MSANGDVASSSSTTGNGNVIIKNVFSGGGCGISDGIVKIEDGEGSNRIAQCAQFPIVSFDKRNKGLTSIIENLKVLQHQKGESPQK